jgi:Ca-activated chloride channel family protein
MIVKRSKWAIRKWFTMKRGDAMKKRSIVYFILLALLAITWMAFPAVSQVDAQASSAKARITQVDVSDFPRVTVYVSVTDDGGFPRPVDPKTIRIFENGVLMEPVEISGEGDIGPLTSMLVMDVSGSMNEAGKLAAAKEAALAYIDLLQPGDQAGVMIFNTKVQYPQPVTEDLDLVRNAIKSLTADKDTAFYDALIKAEEALVNVSGRKAIVVLTDGLDNVSQAKNEDVLAGISEGGFSISTIGLGDPEKKGVNAGLDEGGLISLADQAGGVYAYAEDAATLKSIYENYGMLLKSEYRITYITPSELRDGIRRSLRVEIGEAGAGDAASSEYNPGGVLPEVDTADAWSLFGLLMAALGLLLLVPVLIRILARKSGEKQGKSSKPSKPSDKSTTSSEKRITLKEPPKITLK